jgi:probable HAF family extracellular repeat protein
MSPFHVAKGIVDRTAHARWQQWRGYSHQQPGTSGGASRERQARSNLPPPGPPFFAVLQFKPVVWTRGKVHKLPTTHGDPDGAALAINDNEQIVGNTSDCTASIFHGVMWDHGRAIGLGKFHGLVLGPVAINNRGQVVGSAFDLSGSLVAFLWQNGVTTILGTLAPDVFSLGRGINDRGEIVGDSCDESFSCRAFLWRNGTMTELNDLVSTRNAPLLENAFAINSRGQIAGKTTVQGTPLADAFLATPNHEQSVAEPAVTTRPSPTRQALTSEEIRNLIRWRLVRGYRPVLGSPTN